MTNFLINFLAFEGDAKICQCSSQGQGRCHRNWPRGTSGWGEAGMLAVPCTTDVLVVSDLVDD